MHTVFQSLNIVCVLYLHRLRGAQEELDVVMAQLKEKQDKLATIQAKVYALTCVHTYTHIQTFLRTYVLLLYLQIKDLQASYERSVSEKQELAENMEKTQARLQRAAKLTTGLADEQVRWAESVKVRTFVRYI